MTKQDTIALENFSAAQPRVGTEQSPEISLWEIAALFLKHRGTIGAAVLATALIAGISIPLLPPTYVAEAIILPPQQSQSSLAAFASGAMGGLAGGMSSQLGLKNPADMYIGILKSRTIADDIVREFKLQEVYRKRLLSGARKALNSHATFSSSKESLITISVRDRDAQRAAAIANAYVAELYKQNSRLALTDASQRRLFFEQQLSKEKDLLAEAEIALKETQVATGLLVPTGQAEALIRSGAQLRAEIVSREVQLQAMASYATDQNPQIQVLNRELAALRNQANQIEASGTSGSKLEVSGGRLPGASLAYIRKVREVKYHETLYELLAKQYEAARIDEAKQAPLVQIIDKAVVPDRDSRNRVVVFIGVLLAGIVVSCLLVLVAHSGRAMMATIRSRALTA